MRRFFNDFWKSTDVKPVAFAERLNQAESYINERLAACGETWQSPQGRPCPAAPDHCAPRPKENPATGRRLWRGSGPLKDDATAGAAEIMLPGGPVFRPARLCQEAAGTVIASTLPRHGEPRLTESGLRA